MRWDGWIRADARALPLADSCVQCVVTSPPYWGLRDYGSSGQIGIEKTPSEYVAALCDVFVEVWRVLRPDGTLWLNLGDSYAAGGCGGGGSFMKERAQYAWEHRANKTGFRSAPEGLKPKDLVGIPWRVAFALQAAGWYLRSDIIWAKPNPMPESVTDRPTRAHEYIFLLTKSERYFYDHEAIREPAAKTGTLAHLAGGAGSRAGTRGGLKRDDGGVAPRGERNKRSVWTVATSPYPEAHYATFPPDLIEPCILAGSKPGDIVLDPFAGSGTTARVSEQFGRRWIACDLAYQDLQLRRLSNVQKQLVVEAEAGA